MALKFIQYVMSPEGQARLATSSCYWGMPANTKAALDDQQKKILRFDEQPGFLARAQHYPAPNADLDKKMQDVWTEMMQAQLAAASACPDLAGRALPWALVTPALCWTLLFFVLPFAAMAIVSLTDHSTGAATAGNYAQFFTNPSYLQAMVNSLEVTAHRYRHLRAAGLSLCLDSGRADSRALAKDWPCCWPFCRSGRPTWCAPTAGSWCWLKMVWSTMRLPASGCWRNRCNSPTREPPRLSDLCIFSSCC